MASPSQKYRFNGLSSMTPENLEQLDEMLEDLYTYLSQSPLGTTTEAFDLSALGVVPVDNGGTGLDTFAQGDIVYASATDVLTGLPKNTSATRYLSNQGASNNPSWEQVNLTNGVVNTLPVTSGGTGRASHTAYAVLAGGTGATTAQQSVSGVGTLGQVLTSNGAAALPTWQDSTGGSQWSVLANGDTVNPELIFAGGDVIMLEIP